jgi:PAS domain S-box-containing protein
MDDIFTAFGKAELMPQDLTLIAELASDGIAVLDLNGIIGFINKVGTKMHGYDASSELVGQHISLCHTQQQMKTDIFPFIEEVKRRGQLAGPVEHARRDGTVFPTETKMTLVKDEQGKPAGLIVCVKDMTERTQLKQRPNEQTAELTAANENLQKQLTERKHAQQQLQHYQDQLQHKTDELERANEQLQNQINERKMAEEHLKHQVAEFIAANEKLQQEISDHEQDEEDLLESILEAEDQTKGNIQFNPQELKALAELVERIK